MATRLRALLALQIAAVASVVVNVLIVVTGGAVRLTSSGLGCPSWPSCTGGSLLPTSETSTPGIIEFSNRSLTAIIGVVAVCTLAVAVLQRRERTLAAVAFAGIPAQAVLGGITVLTHLNPWVVAGHFLLSMAILAVTASLLWRLIRPTAADGHMRPPRPVGTLAAFVVAVTAATLVLGTIVTASGPHAGDRNESGLVRRTGLDPRAMSQLHADAVMVLIGLTIGLVLVVIAVRASVQTRRAAVVLLGIELAQGAIGFVQYFTGLPVVVVGFHMLGACLVWLAALNVLLRVAAPVGPPSQQLGDGVDHQTDEGADHGAVDPDELKITADL